MIFYAKRLWKMIKLNLKAQVGLEYLFIIGFFLLLAIPMFFFAYSQANWYNRYNLLYDAVSTIATTADTVCALGEGSLRYAIIELPYGVDYVNITNKEIILHTSRFGDVYAETKCDVEGNFSVVPGIKHIPIVKQQGKVIIGNISVTAPPSPEDLPIITFVPPTPDDGATVTTDYVFINTTITDNDGIVQALLEWNGVNETMLNSGDIFYKNKTGLSNGVYTYKVYAQDGDGYWNSSEIRTVTVNKTYITCDIFYGTATESSGVVNPDNALASDDAYAVLPADDDWVRVTTFNLNNSKNKGDITSVEIAMEYHREGVYINDRILLAYYVGTALGSTYAYYLDAASDTTVYLNVTSDRAWTWSDIQQLKIHSEYARRGSQDSLDWYVDTLFVRICYYTW